MRIELGLCFGICALGVGCSGDARIVGEAIGGTGANPVGGASNVGGGTLGSLGGISNVVGGAPGSGGVATTQTTATGTRVTCGVSTCLVGEKCCDASCGMCSFGGICPVAACAAGGASSTGGAQGTSGSSVNCALVGCAAPPLCSTGCTDTCGCCPCSEGSTQGTLVCTGGCWASSGAGGATATGGKSALGGTSGAPAKTGGANTISPGTSGTGGVDCGCVTDAAVYVCGSDGVTYDAACNDACVPVPISCRQKCPCALAAGGASSAGGSASTGGTGGTSTGYGGLCNSGCSVAQVAMASVCSGTQVLLSCSSPYPSDLTTIMSRNGCTATALDVIMGYCCPQSIQTQCL